MQIPSEEEFKESIKELSEYKNRLVNEVESISKKLKMPHEKIKSTIEFHHEIKNLKSIISTLKKQRKNITKDPHSQS